MNLLSLKLNVVIILVIKVGSVGLNFCGLAALANYMSTESFGSFVRLYSLSMMISIPLMFGMNFSLVRYTSDESIDLKERATLAYFALRKLALVLISVWLVVSVISLVVYEMVQEFFLLTELPVALAFACIYAASEVVQSVCRVFDGPKSAFLYREILWRLCFFLVPLLSILTGVGLSSSTILSILGSLLFVILATQVYFSGLRSKKVHSLAFSECSHAKSQERILRKAPSFVLVGCLSTASQHVVVVIASITLTLEQTARFFTSLKVMQLLFLSVVAVNFVITPMLRNIQTTLGGKIDINRITKLCNASAWANVLFCLMGTAFFGIAGNLVLGSFGAEYERDVLLLLILCVAAFFNAMTGPSGFVLIMFDRQGAFNFASAVSLLLGGGTCLFFGQFYGLIGFCWGYVIWVALQNVATAILSKKLLKINTTFFGFPRLRSIVS